MWAGSYLLSVIGFDEKGFKDRNEQDDIDYFRFDNGRCTICFKKWKNG